MKILLATDGSESALQAAYFVAALAAEDKSTEVHLVSVKDSRVAVSMTGDESAPTLVNENVQQADAEADSALNDAEKAIAAVGGIVANKATVWGNPADEICSMAKNIGADLTVVGSTGKGAVAGLFVGSVSSQVVQRCNSPVLVVR